MSSVVVVGRRSCRDVDVSELEVGREHAPWVGPAGVAPRSALPGLVAELALLGNRVELPELLAGAHVVAAHVARRRQLVPRSVADHGPDDHDVADDDRRGHQLVFAARHVAPDALECVDRTADPESFDRPAGACVERPEVGIAGREEDARRLAVGPVGDAPRVEAGVRRPVALPHLGVEAPQRFARGRVDRGGLAEGRLDIENAVHHDRRGLERCRKCGQLSAIARTRRRCRASPIATRPPSDARCRA